MSYYKAPVDDMRFVLRAVAGLDAVAALPGYEDATPDLVDAVLEEAGRFGAEVLAPLNAAGDRQGARFANGVVSVPAGFTEAYAQFVDGGWNALPFAVEHGGQGLPALVATAVLEVWTAANMSFALCPLLTQAAAHLFAHHGDDWVKGTCLLKLVSGEWTGTMLLTEPQAGSDLGAVRTRARPEGRHYRLSGQKIYITYGEHDLAPNILHAVLARTPDAPSGAKGLSLFVVPKFLINADGSLGARNDLRCVSIEHKLGIHASPTAVMSFGDAEGAWGWLVGEEGHGLEQMFTMMNAARLAVGLEGVGIADRSAQAARAYAFDRVQGRELGARSPQPVPIIRHPDVQRMLAEMKAQTQAARALAYYVAARSDLAARHPDPALRDHHQQRLNLLTPVVKAWCTDVGMEVASTAIQVHGGMGYIEESGVPQLLRDARIAPIYEGTNGIQAMDLVTRKIAGDGGAAARALLAEADADANALAEANDALLRAIGANLGEALREARQATEWVVATWPQSPQRVAAGATPFLRLFGDVTAGWLMAVAALAARQSTDPSPWLDAKVRTALFYADTRLALAGGWRRTAERAGDALADIDPEQFF